MIESQERSTGGLNYSFFNLTTVHLNDQNQIRRDKVTMVKCILLINESEMKPITLTFDFYSCYIGD